MPSTFSKKHALQESTIINPADNTHNNYVAKEPSTKKSHTSLKTQNYKQLHGKNFWWVPRERYIKQKVAEFIKPIENTDVEFAPYCAKMNSSDPIRASMHEQVYSKAHHVSCFTPEMKNGRLKTGKMIHRAFVSKIKGTNNITGAVSIEINLDTRFFEVVAIHVDDEQQGKKIGSYLFHTAILIGLLYGCENVYCRSTSVATEFYRKHGFVGESGADSVPEVEIESVPEPVFVPGSLPGSLPGSGSESESESEESNFDDESDGECFNLNFLEDVPRNQFIAVVKKWNPLSTMEELINQVRSNVNTLDQKEKLLADMISTGSDFRPEGSDFPAMAFLAAYANRKQVSVASFDETESESEADDISVGLPVNNEIANSSTNHSVTSSSTAQTGVNPTPIFQSSATMWKPLRLSQEVVDPDLESWLACLNS